MSRHNAHTARSERIEYVRKNWWRLVKKSPREQAEHMREMGFYSPNTAVPDIVRSMAGIFREARHK